jgi:hypothetical protein
LRTASTKRKTLPRVSKRRRRELDAYSPAAKAFLAVHPICQVWMAENGWEELPSAQAGSMIYGIKPILLLHYDHGAPWSTEVHHRAGRHGQKLLDQADWMAVSRPNHERIHRRPSWARHLGMLK